MLSLKQARILALTLGLLIIFAPSLRLPLAVHAATTYTVTTIPVGTAPIFEVYDPVNGNVYVANGGSNDVSVISSSTDTVIATIPVGPGPSWISWMPGNGDVYVSNQGSDTVSRISSSTNTVVATITVMDMPHMISFDFANGDIYVGSLGTTTVARISSTTNVPTFITVQNSPQHVTYDPVNHDMYASNYFSNSLSRIDSTTNAVTDTIAVGPNPSVPLFDPANGNLYVPDFGAGSSNTVSVVSSLTDTVVATITVGTGPILASYNPANQDVYVNNRFSNFVSVIDSSTNTVTSIPVAGGNSWTARNPSDNTLFVTDEDVSQVSVIDANTQSVIATVTVGSGPHVAIYDFSNGGIYTVDQGSNTASAIFPSTPGGQPCRENDGTGDFHGANGKGNFHADDDKCEDGKPNQVSSTNLGDGQSFQSNAITTTTYDDTTNMATITGLGTHGGVPVSFTFVEQATSPTTPGWVSFILSDGYNNAGTLTSGSIELG